jgi:siderophore synthetase component
MSRPESDRSTSADPRRARTLAADCSTPAEHAASATLHAFLNCYLRETATVDVVPVERASLPADADLAAEVEAVAVTPLPEIGGELAAPLRYRSPTGRHLFDRPIYRRVGDADPTPLDASLLAALVCRDLSLAADDGAAGELLARVLSSEENVQRFVAARAGDGAWLYGDDLPFRAAEQALPYGHLLHPTPKSRRGIARRNAPTYAPELEGSFQLHYFRADPAVVDQESARETSAASWVKSALRESAGPDFVADYVESEDVLLPVHPWQAAYLLDQPRVRRAISAGRLESLGRRGRTFHPTTSVRTAYAPDAPFMHKGSLAVRITNAERTNKRPELERGVAIAELLDTDLGDDLRRKFPRFEIVRDPAYLTLDLGDGPESGFEVVLRENPFELGTNATPVVALCQDGIDGPSRLVRIVERLAEREGRSTDAVASEWFRRYLAISLRPALWLYLQRGVGVEAHQQNAVLELDGGYPGRFYYRDNQGYYLPESWVDAVEALLPGIGARAGTVCPDAVADERLRYYLVCNNAFGVINALGVGRAADERDLLAVLRAELEGIERRYGRPTSALVPDLLEEPSIPCKANLLTRFEGLDELVGSLENQSVYAPIDNPLVTEFEDGTFDADAAFDFDFDSDFDTP